MSDNTERIRSFIAIELPEDLQGRFAALRSQLERGEHSFVKWADPKGIHLTLKFLGNIPLGQVEEITRAIEGAVQGIPPFRLETSELGGFPNLGQPRVLWIGIRGETDRLSRLQHSIDYALTSLGFAKEERPFMPHLTLARLRQGTYTGERKSFGDVARSVRYEGGYPIDAKAVSLMRSQLTPRGPIYTRLSATQLERGRAPQEPRKSL